MNAGRPKAREAVFRPGVRSDGISLENKGRKAGGNRRSRGTWEEKKSLTTLHTAESHISNSICLRLADERSNEKPLFFPWTAAGQGGRPGAGGWTDGRGRGERLRGMREVDETKRAREGARRRSGRGVERWCGIVVLRQVQDEAEEMESESDRAGAGVGDGRWVGSRGKVGPIALSGQPQPRNITGYSYPTPREFRGAVIH